MSPLRRKIADRLVSAQHTAAILTTFNETDLSKLIALRSEVQPTFQAEHGVKLGFMSFFIQAAVHALKAVPAVNARIEGDEIVEQHYYDIGVAVGTDKGLVVPVLRDCDQLDLPGIEKALADVAQRAREGKLSLPDLEGGVFTISNGGVYGSVMSTPILNPPQSAILGMHAIQSRPVVIDGQVEIRPMMNLALSYDHRIIDGKEAVTFLIEIKKFVENPTLALFGLSPS
jgi:2-oxoglutarate dehydrogenase E2 component (dihydrolipoamide succinyltransferase)